MRPTGRVLNVTSGRAELYSVMGHGCMSQKYAGLIDGLTAAFENRFVWPKSVEFCLFNINFLLMCAKKHIQVNSIFKSNVFV